MKEYSRCLLTKAYSENIFEIGVKWNMTYRKKPSTSDPEIAEPDVFLKPGKWMQLDQF